MLFLEILIPLGELQAGDAVALGRDGFAGGVRNANWDSWGDPEIAGGRIGGLGCGNAGALVSTRARE